jgi:hypothetical protein
VTATGTVIVHRPRGGWRDFLRAYRVQLDGVDRGKVRRGETLTLAVEPGQHWLRARIDWTGSPDVSLAVVEGSVHECLVEPGGSAFTALSQVFGRADYLRLSVMPDPG